MEPLKTLEIETGNQPRASVIWLHGLGASGHDFEPVVPEFRFARQRPVRFIFPHAPEIPVTVNGGMVMPAWYDILAMDIDRKLDAAQLQASADAVAKLVEKEVSRGVEPANIIIGGFSQGGAVAYELALRYPDRLAGLFALSTYFATADTVQRSSANKALPVFIGHGTHDPMVPVSLGEAARDKLDGMGYPTEFRTYPMDHSVCLEEIRDLDEFIARCLGAGVS